MKKKSLKTKKQMRKKLKKLHCLPRFSKKRGGDNETTVPINNTSQTEGYYDFSQDIDLEKYDKSLSSISFVSDFFAFSDLEGANPFKFEPTDIVYKPNKDKITKQMEFSEESISDIEGVEDNNVLTEETVKEEVKNKFSKYFDMNNGCITNLNSANYAIAYTGDLFDNQVNIFTLLKSMIRLKELRPNNVILIGGNRDVNKLRLGIEAYMMNDDDSLPWTKSLSNFINIDNIQFRLKNAPRYLTWNKKKFGEDDIIYSTSTALARVDKLIRNMAATLNSIIKSIELTFTSDIVQTAIKKYREANANNEKEPLCRIICVLFMIMSFEWKDNIFDKDGWDIFKEYNGLIYKYLKLSHPIALFKFNEKYGVLTHRGYDKYTYPRLGLDTEKLDESDFKNGIMEINNDWYKLLTEYNDYMHKKIYDNNKDNNDSTCTSLDCNMYRWQQYPGPSDMAGNKNNNNRSPMYPPKDVVTEYPDYNIKIDGKDTKLTYNIYGHQPQLFFPAVRKNTSTYHICLDVCKADYGSSGNSSYSFAMLHLSDNKDVNTLFGRTRLGQLKDNALAMQDKIIYYNTTLDNFKNRITMPVEPTIILNNTINDKNLFDFKEKNIRYNNYMIKTNKDFNRIIYNGKATGGRKTRRKKHICRTYNCRHRSHLKKYKTYKR